MTDSVDVIRDEDIDLALRQEIPLSFARNNVILPLRKENGLLSAAVSDDRGLLALIELSKRYGLRPRPLKAETGVVIDAINRFYGQVGTAQEVMEGISGEDLSSVATEFESPKDLLELTEDAPIIRLLNALLLQAVKESGRRG